MRIWLSVREAKALLGAVGGIGLVVGGVAVVAAGPVSRLLGMPGEPRSLWALRLFGVRDVVLGLGLRRAAAAEGTEAARILAEMTILAQAGDLLVTTLMAATGHVSRRAAFAVWSSAPGTLLACLVARDGLVDGREAQA